MQSLDLHLLVRIQMTTWIFWSRYQSSGAESWNCCRVWRTPVSELNWIVGHPVGVKRAGELLVWEKYPSFDVRIVVSRHRSDNERNKIVPAFSLCPPGSLKTLEHMLPLNLYLWLDFSLQNIRENALQCLWLVLVPHHVITWWKSSCSYWLHLGF